MSKAEPEGAMSLDDVMEGLDDFADLDEAMGPVPADASPEKKAWHLFRQWHIDEAVGPGEAGVYADRLIERMTAAGLKIVGLEDA